MNETQWTNKPILPIVNSNGHCFNIDAINQWFTQHVCCPVCRYDIRTYQNEHIDDSSNNNIDDSSIFAQIDAFIQRCKDLLIVCEGQLQFCRKDRAIQEGGKNGKKRHSLPAFGGANGKLIMKSLYGIEDTFIIYINKLERLTYNILDVNSTQWHDDYTYFKNGIKELEVMMGNIINNALPDMGEIFKLWVNNTNNDENIKGLIANAKTEESVFGVAITEDDKDKLQKSFTKFAKEIYQEHGKPETDLTNDNAFTDYINGIGEYISYMEGGWRHRQLKRNKLKRKSKTVKKNKKQKSKSKKNYRKKK